MKNIFYKGFNNRFFFLLAGLLISLPFSIFLTNLLGLLLFLNTFTAPKELWNRNSLLTPLPVLFILFFGIHALSLLWSSAPMEGIKYLGQRISFLLMPIVLGVGIPSLHDRHILRLKNFFIAAVSLSALYALIFALVTYIRTGSWYRYWPDGSIHDHLLFYTGLAEPVMHPGYFSVYIGIAFFLLLKRFRKDSNKLFIGSWLAFLFIFLLMLQGRINLIGFGLTFGVYVIYILLKRKNYRLLTGTITAAVAVVMVLLFVAPDSVRERFLPSLSLEYDLDAPSMESFSGFTIRLAEWHCATDVIEDNFWKGTGVTDSKKALLESYRKNNFVMGMQRKFNAHNQYLETLMATGIAGLVILLLLFAFMLRAAIHKKDVFYGMIVIYFFLSMLTESMLERHWAITLFCSLLLLLGMAPSSEEKPTKEPETRA